MQHTEDRVAEVWIWFMDILLSGRLERHKTLASRAVIKKPALPELAKQPDVDCSCLMAHLRICLQLAMPETALLIFFGRRLDRLSTLAAQLCQWLMCAVQSECLWFSTAAPCVCVCVCVSGSDWLCFYMMWLLFWVPAVAVLLAAPCIHSSQSLTQLSSSSVMSEN